MLSVLLFPCARMVASDTTTPAATVDPSVKKTTAKSTKPATASTTSTAGKAAAAKSGTATTAKGAAKSSSGQKTTVVAKSHVTARPTATKATVVKTKLPIKPPSALSIKLTSAFLASAQLRADGAAAGFDACSGGLCGRGKLCEGASG